jgi:hypothetical protein
MEDLDGFNTQKVRIPTTKTKNVATNGSNALKNG